MDHPHYFEWWYFDVVTKNGTILIIEYHASNLAIRDEIPLFIISIYLPDGEIIKRETILEKKDVKISDKVCDIQYLNNTITEDEKQIQIKWNISDVALDLKFEKQHNALYLDDVKLFEDPITKHNFLVRR